jgi:hypothetical protein
MGAAARLRPLTGTQLLSLLLGLLVLVSATGTAGNLDHGTLVAPMHSLDVDLDPDTGSGDLPIGPLPPVQVLSLDFDAPARLVGSEPRPQQGLTEAPPDRPPTRAD